MPRMVDLDVIIEKAKMLAEEAPGLLSTLEAAGWTGASKITPFAPMVGPLTNLLSKLAGGDDGLTISGMPNLGPKGRGRLSYLRNARSYSDENVVSACERVTMGGFSQSKNVADTVNFTLRCMFPDVAPNQWNSNQTRRAIDKILEDDGMTEGTCDKLGDMINYALTHQVDSKSTTNQEHGE